MGMKGETDHQEERSCGSPHMPHDARDTAVPRAQMSSALALTHTMLPSPSPSLTSHSLVVDIAGVCGAPHLAPEHFLALLVC